MNIFEKLCASVWLGVVVVFIPFATFFILSAIVLKLLSYPAALLLVMLENSSAFLANTTKDYLEWALEVVEAFNSKR